MNIAILGTRGVPPRYGGFETFAAELGRRLAGRDHRVTVYCRKALYEDEPRFWEGIERVELPAIAHKYLETVSHALLSALHAARHRFDVVLVCNAANAFVLPLLNAARIATAINVDGIERRRKKWNAIGRLTYMIGETMSVEFAGRIIADAGVIADYYKDTLGVRPQIIAYGADFPEEPDSDVLSRLNLAARGYVLYVSRFEPENNPLAVVHAFESVRTMLPLVMVGDAPYASELIRELKATPDRRVLFPGALYGADYRTLQRNALVYIQATEVGGTHPALIEAMASGGAVLANASPENREVGRSAIRYFDVDSIESLRGALQTALDDPDQLEGLRLRAHRRAGDFSWEAVTDAYERLFRGVAGL
ncbi:MAG TPA: DUF1972 domain-containing protein [Thermoanaerobaculia bacterium]|nr:DUF1972 domain-containing protein [Thermoanaerobaculia bacterium]